MMGDEARARDVFQATVREAAFLAANGDAPPDRLWFFREARWRCLDAVAKGVQAEASINGTAEISKKAPEQVARLETAQLAAWISAASEPQRSAVALYYLDHFTYREILSLTGLKLNEFASAIAAARREFQAWLNAAAPAVTE